MKFIKTIVFVFSVILMSISCAVLKPVTASISAPLSDYKYVYITPTSGLTSSTGSVYGGGNSIYGTTQTKSVNPSDLIAGGLIKYGFIRLPKLKTELSAETIIVSYGESGRRNVMGGLAGYTIEVTIQFISAETHKQICIVSAEGQGSTEADDIRIAINRCLKKIFE